MLSLAPLRGLGLISYGLYLWHWPVFVVLNPDRVGFGGWGLSALRYASALGIALASYWLVEQPIRRGRLLQGWTARLAPAVAAIAVVVALVASDGRRVVGRRPRLGSRRRDLRARVAAGRGARGADVRPRAGRHGRRRRGAGRHDPGGPADVGRRHPRRAHPDRAGPTPRSCRAPPRPAAGSGSWWWATPWAARWPAASTW